MLFRPTPPSLLPSPPQRLHPFRITSTRPPPLFPHPVPSLARTPPSRPAWRGMEASGGGGRARARPAEGLGGSSVGGKPRRGAPPGPGVGDSPPPSPATAVPLAPLTLCPATSRSPPCGLLSSALRGRAARP